MSVEGYFKTNWRGVGMLRNVAAWMNQVGRFLNGMSIIGGVTSRKNGTITFSVTPRQHGGDGCTEGDYAFKITATEELDGNGDPYDPPKFTVNVLGGTAQTLGGTPYVYDDEELSDVEEGWHIYVVYENLEPSPSFTEYGEWRPGIKASSETDMADYTAPHDLVFEIGRISKEYSGNVRQGHKGNIVMPAISNVVDIQTQLP